jgi:proteic killer suppression protein
MIKTFKCKQTAALFERKVVKQWQMIERIARRKLEMINAANTLYDLTVPPNNRLEGLKGNRKGQYSIRINAQYRVCFEWNSGHAESVEIVDYH